VSEPVSVVIPVRDRETRIGRAIGSVLAQTCLPAEIIVIDDRSTDGTLDVIRSYGDRVRVLHGTGCGAYAARNAAIRSAMSPLIAFLDSDDAWLPRKLELQLPLFDDPEVGVVFGNAAVIREENGRRVPSGTTFDRTPPGRARRKDFLRGNFISFTTTIVRRDCFEKCGFFDERLSADYLAFFRMAGSYRLAYVGAPVAEYVLHARNWSGSLEASLRSRLELFAEELARATDPDERELLERLAFNLRLHLRIAALRGMASKPPKVGWRPRRIGWAVAYVWAWTFGRFARQLRLSN
jgi:glycosyltransferase involved in cell wall biosynthesis